MSDSTINVPNNQENDSVDPLLFPLGTFSLSLFSLFKLRPRFCNTKE